MATLVEVTQKKPVVQDLTLKLTRAEATDLKVFIGDWYKRNYTGSSQTYYMENDSIIRALNTALEGKAEASKVKIAAWLY